MSTVFSYLLLGIMLASVLTPFILLFFLFRTRPSILPTTIRHRAALVWWLALALAVIYVGIIISPIIAYLSGAFVSSPTDSLSPIAKMYNSIAAAAFLGLVFCGTIVSSCILYIRTLINVAIIEK